MKYEGCPNEARLSQYKILGKNKGGEVNDQVISLMEGDRASLDSLTMPLQIRPSHKRAWATYGRVGPGTKPIPSKKGGLGGGEQLQLLSRRKGELRRKYHYQVGAHLVTTEAYILNCTLHLSLKIYLRGILDLLLCSAVETYEASKRWQVYLLFFASRSKARHKFTTTDIRSVVNRKS